MKKISTLILAACLMLFIVGYAAAQEQKISLIPETTTLPVGETLSVTVQYDSTDNTLSGIGFRVHFDSSKLTCASFSYLFETGKLADPQLQDDLENKDNDAATDKLVLFAYQELSGNWPGQAFPLNLAKLRFTAPAPASTTLRVTQVTGAPGFGFAGIGASILITASGSNDGMTAIPMDFDHWYKVSCGVGNVTSEGIQIYGSAYRQGNGIRSKIRFDLTNSQVFLKWKVNVGYMGCGLGFGNCSIGFTTDHSWSGSTVASYNTWYYTRFAIHGEEKRWTAVTSTGNYDTKGGTLFKEDTGTLEDGILPYLANSIITFSFWDNYSGTNSYAVIGEAWTTAPEKSDAVLGESYDFESGVLPSAFKTVSGNWVIDSAIGDGSGSSLYTQGNASNPSVITLEVKDIAYISFATRVIDDSVYCGAHAMVDDTLWMEIDSSGTDCWNTNSVIPIPSGTHSVKWVASGDQTYCKSNVSLWIDNIRLFKSVSHFIPVWSGQSPFKRMNLWLTSIQGIEAGPGDEIGIFDGEKCVGSAMIHGEISPAKPLTITASMAHTDADGFTEGHKIFFRFWDSELAKEIAITPGFSDMTGTPVTPPGFTGDGDYGVTLTFGNDPDISVSPDSHNFGTTNLGDSSEPQTFTISNTGNADLVIGTLSLSGSDAAEFTIQNDTCSGKAVPPGETCTIEIRFSPASPGIKTAVLKISSDDPETPELTVWLDAYGYDSDHLSCSMPITGAVLTPTIQSVKDGHWNSASTWDKKRVPGPDDIVLIRKHKIENLPGVVTIKAMCNYGEVVSSPDASLEIRAEQGITNYTVGIIRGQNGEAASTRTAAADNRAGKDIILKTAQNIKQTDKFGNWWWSARDAGPIYNDGQIIGGDGADGGKGGDALLLGRNVTNDINGVIRGGKGGDGQQGGAGGLTQVFGKLGGPGTLISKGSIIAGDGGNGVTSGGKGGNLWLVSLPNVYLGVDRTSYMTRSTVSSHHAGKGGSPGAKGGKVIIEPNLISIRAGAEISGGDITIFGGDDFVLDFTEAQNAFIKAEGDITLSVGKNGAVDFTGCTETLFKAGGAVKVFADDIRLDGSVSLSDISQAESVETGSGKR